MSFAELLILAVGLCFDTFAVSLSSGMCLPQIPRWSFIRIVSTFAFFQAMFAFLGWILGQGLDKIIGAFDHWVAFILLAYIGGKMIKEGLTREENEVCIDVRNPRILLTVSVATSIDAMAVGIGLAVTSLSLSRIGMATGLIFIVTAIASVIGLKGGRFISAKAGKSSEIVGGLILIAIGLKILVEHLEILT